MGGFLNEGTAGITELKPRHIDQIAGDIDRARQTEAAATRVTPPMQTAPPIDEIKAAAETQRMPVQGDAPRAPTRTSKAEAQLTAKGAAAPQPLTADETREINAFANERNRTLKQLREADTADLPQEARASIRRAENSLRDHLAPDDVAGAVKEARGVTIPDPRGGVFDHVREVMNARDGIVNAIEDLKEALATMERTGASEAQRDQVRSILSLFSQTIDDLEKRM